MRTIFGFLVGAAISVFPLMIFVLIQSHMNLSLNQFQCVLVWAVVTVVCITFPLGVFMAGKISQ